MFSEKKRVSLTFDLGNRRRSLLLEKRRAAFQRFLMIRKMQMLRFRFHWLGVSLRDLEAISLSKSDDAGRARCISETERLTNRRTAVAKELSVLVLVLVLDWMYNLMSTLP
ncbi:uncharacterized protein LOC129582875 [Paramacrobiotus metropolitanus]|uniref:uncharacterized protein LOC129582875 n=1 Tax=Paramacrobiotus metropolitanus TaxID=2943436 RepID=UPI0024458E16|nr:uncharacterized protein LOC129582875 [Paramacrobiotus metropolitanus]